MLEQKTKIGIVTWGIDTPYHHLFRRNTEMITIHHSHEYYEILILFSGSILQYVNQQKIPMKSNQMLILRPGDVHASAPQCFPQYLFSMQVSVPEMKLFTEAYGLGNSIAENNWKFTFNLSENLSNEISNYCARLTGLYETEENKSLYKIILGKIMEGCLASRVHEDVPPWLRGVLEKMSLPENTAEGVPALVRMCWMSHSQVYRQIKKYFGISPQQYVQNLRMGLARSLVESTNKDIDSIAQEVGFNNVSHFCTLFKKTFHMTPSEMRHHAMLSR